MTTDNSILEDLLRMSRRAGERFDLVQAGGGNTSAKLSDGKMLVKASGLRLSDLNSEKAFVLIDNKTLRQRVLEIDWSSYDKKEKEKKASELVANLNLTPDRRPSIETLLHSSLDGFVLHTHPVQVAALFSQTNAKEKLAELLPDSALVFYKTPGVELALEMLAARTVYLKEKGKEPSSYVFQNHGLVTFGETWTKAFQHTEEICQKLSAVTRLDFAFDRISNLISQAMEVVTKESWVTVHIPGCQSNEISIEQKPFLPDGVVFLGMAPLLIQSTEKEILEKQIQDYLKKYTIVPRSFVLDGQMFFTGKTYAKARESEEVWRLHHIASQFTPDALSEEELTYLSHWESEKYRQKV